ncbi:MAG: radical SAM protein [Planctomycetota bacterium]|nr:MAG: radical SAM protein [Planctomycetota bacterium]
MQIGTHVKNDAHSTPPVSGSLPTDRAACAPASAPAGRGELPVLPDSIRVEAVASCQLKCPSCPTATGAIRRAIPAGYLRFESFKRLVDSNPTVRHVELSNYGEMFLNPDLVRILEYADKCDVVLTANNGVNLNTADEDVLQALVTYRFHSMTCSIDGASQETYEIYRRKGRFERVIENVRAINRFKKQHNSQHPILTWQFIVFGHNEHEVPRVKQLCRELDMLFKPKISWDDDFSPIRDPEFVLRETGLPDTRQGFREQHGVDYSRNVCLQLWNQPQINWDGRILGCGRNFWGDFGGNAFTDGLSAALNNEKMCDAREMLIGRREPRDDVPCTTCENYLSMRQNGDWISQREIRIHRLFHRAAMWKAPSVFFRAVRSILHRKRLLKVLRRLC